MGYFSTVMPGTRTLVIFSREKDGVEEGKSNKKILLYSWLPTGTYHKNIMIWTFYFILKLANLGHFFHAKS